MLNMSLSETRPEWSEDCLRLRGRVLTGKWAHYCWDLDGLPIDETCPEFSFCTCEMDESHEPRSWFLYTFMVLLALSCIFEWLVIRWVV